MIAFSKPDALQANPSHWWFRRIGAVSQNGYGSTASNGTSGRRFSYSQDDRPDSPGLHFDEPVPIEGSETIYPVDAAVCAIGNSPNPLILATTPGLEAGKKSNIVADEETGRTSIERVWAGGDVVTGAATVILAMGAGRKAARSIDEYLATH